MNPKGLMGLTLCLAVLLVLGVNSVRGQTHLFPVTIDHKWGYLDSHGLIVIPGNFDLATPFSEGLAAVQIDGKWGFVDSNGVLAIRPSFASVGRFSEGLAGACEDYYQCGYIDREGKWAIGPHLAFQGKEFSEGLTAVWNGNAWGYIDRTGEWVIKPTLQVKRSVDYCHVCPLPFSRSLTSLDPDADRASLMGEPDINFYEGRAANSPDRETWGFIDKKGQWVVAPTYSWVGRYVDGRAPVLPGNRFGFVDLYGKQVVPPQFEEVQGFSQGLAAAAVDGKWGFIDASGRWVISPKFDDVLPFSEGLASVAVGGIWGMIERQGRFVLSPQSNWIYLGQVLNGVARALIQFDDSASINLVDTKGNIVWRGYD